MNILDIFCGTKSWTKMYKVEDTVLTLDLDYTFSPTFCRNILTFDYKSEIDIPIDVIYASPPCDLYFTNLKHLKGTTIYTEIDKKLSIELVQKTIEIIKYFSPKFFIIENPVGKMRRHFPEILNYRYKTVSYCMYGFPIRKNTDIWTNLNFIPKRCIHKKHEFGIRQQKFGIKRYNPHNSYSKRENGRIPPILTDEIYQLIKKEKVP